MNRRLVAGLLAFGLSLFSHAASATTCVPPTQNWSDFPSGYQCIVGVDHFIANHWGLPFPATGGHPTNGACEALGACMEWVDNLPDGNTWNRHDWGSVPAQAYDVLIFPPHGSDGYGHAAMFDHEEGGTIFVMDDNWDGNMARSCSWAGHDGWVHSGTWTPYGFYRLKSLEPVVDQAPNGSLDSAACDAIGGWSQDPDDKAAHVFTDVYFDGPAGTSTESIRLTADQSRPDLCSAIGSCDHAFSMPTPLSLLDGTPHQVFAYGIDTVAGGPNSLLPGSPKSFTCAPPKPPISPAVKRHIVNPDSLTAWQLSMFSQVAKYDQATSDGIPTGSDEPTSPVLAKADDGSADVWVLDDGARRHVVDPTSMSAWKFDASKIDTMSSVQLYELPEGLAWPATPFAFVDPTGAVYLVDSPVTSQSAGSAGSGGSSGSGGAASAGRGGAGSSAKGGSAGAVTTAHAGAGGMKSSEGGAAGTSSSGAAGAPSKDASSLSPVAVDGDKELGACAISTSRVGFGFGAWGVLASLLVLARRRRRA